MVPKNWWSRIFEQKIVGQNGEKGVKNMHFWAFLGNQTIDFSGFWYVTSLIYYFKYGIGSFARKKIVWVENGEKGVKNMHFLAFLSNQTIDFSDFWYVTSLMYYFKYGIGSFARKIYFGPKLAKKVSKKCVFEHVSATSD